MFGFKTIRRVDRPCHLTTWHLEVIYYVQEGSSFVTVVFEPLSVWAALSLTSLRLGGLEGTYQLTVFKMHDSFERAHSSGQFTPGLVFGGTTFCAIRVVLKCFRSAVLAGCGLCNLLLLVSGRYRLVFYLCVQCPLFIAVTRIA